MRTGDRSNGFLRHNAKAHDKVAEVYDSKHAEIYNSVEQARLEYTIDELLRLAETASPEVLDFGAGTGNVTLKLLRRGCRVTAADVSRRSLEVLKKKAEDDARLSTLVLGDGHIPCNDGSFDAVVTYSVLHHVPDYLHAVREMARVLRPGGLLYIDHEANDVAWSDNADLDHYREATRLSTREHVKLLARTGELFTYAFAKTVLMKAFVDRRYEREGDLHVWPDDHIEWNKVRQNVERAGMEIVKTCDYLLYQPRGGIELYAHYSALCSDTRYIFARKLRGDGTSSK